MEHIYTDRLQQSLCKHKFLPLSPLQELSNLPDFQRKNQIVHAVNFYFCFLLHDYFNQCSEVIFRGTKPENHCTELSCCEMEHLGLNMNLIVATVTVGSFICERESKWSRTENSISKRVCYSWAAVVQVLSFSPLNQVTENTFLPGSALLI